MFDRFFWNRFILTRRFFCVILVVGARVRVLPMTAIYLPPSDAIGSLGRTRRRDVMEKKKREYTADMPARIYAFFCDYSEAGVPSLSKFAVRCGITLAELRGWRENPEFDKACAECGEIRRDLLIDAALARRHDPSFSKFLLSAEFGMGDGDLGGKESLEVSIEVIE